MRTRQDRPREMDWATRHAIETGQLAPPSPLEQSSSGDRIWTWRLGLGLAIVFVWVLMGLYYMALALWAMGDCFGLACAVHHQEIVDGDNLGLLFAACALVASCLGVVAAVGRQRAAAALAIFCGAVGALSLVEPSPESGMRATGFMAVALAPLFVLAVLRWNSLRRPAPRSTPTTR
jgi:hypothetical protein